MRDFLASGGIRLPEGERTDPPERETGCGPGKRQDGYFHALTAMSPLMHLDRITIRDHQVAPRSATLWSPGIPERMPSAPWSVTVACERLPEDLRSGDAPVEFQGWAASGRCVHGSVRIQSRHDDAYGTKLTLVGIGPLGAGLHHL